MVLNDNAHGIGPATGALASYFSRFRTSTAYMGAKKEAKKMLKALDEQGGVIGRAFHDVIDHVKAAAHGLMPAPHPGCRPWGGATSRREGAARRAQRLLKATGKCRACPDKSPGIFCPARQQERAGIPIECQSVGVRVPRS